MNDNSKKRRIGFVYAWQGLKTAIRTERNFRLHVVAAFLVIATGCAFRLEALQWSILMLASGMVLTAELINTAVEKMMDHLTPEFHPCTKVVKDMAAAAVLVSAVFAAAAGLFIFLPELYARIT